jgi:hypothetical protein
MGHTKIYKKNKQNYLYDPLQDGHPEVADVAVLDLKLRMNQDQDGGSNQGRSNGHLKKVKIGLMDHPVQPNYNYNPCHRPNPNP